MWAMVRDRRLWSNMDELSDFAEAEYEAEPDDAPHGRRFHEGARRIERTAPMDLHDLAATDSDESDSDLDGVSTRYELAMQR